MRVPEISKNCRYGMAITTISGFQKFEYVGDIADFGTVKKYD
jgi:hypothetical protein